MRKRKIFQEDIALEILPTLLEYGINTCKTELITLTVENLSHVNRLVKDLISLEKQTKVCIIDSQSDCDSYISKRKEMNCKISTIRSSIELFKR